MFWQTRTLASFIAATVPVGKGESNPLLDAAREIGEPRTEDNANGGQQSTAEPRTGSYEALMTMFRPR